GENVNYGPFTLGHQYTYLGNGLKKSFTGPNGEAIGYSYDENNRLAGISIPGQGYITYSNHTWNSPTKITLPGGSSTEIKYDSLMRVSSIIGKNPGQDAIMSHGYQYSLTENLISKTTEHGDYNYQYDKLHRLIEAKNPLNDDEAYTYDALDNRLSAEGVEGPWNYNANNELTGYGAVTFDHDANGNMIRKIEGLDQKVFVYDIEDRLIRVEDGSGNDIAEYYYDPFGRRLWKEVDGVRTYFVYSDEGLIGEYDDSGAEIKSYGYKPDSMWNTDPLFQKSA
ncbi:MAG: hypothetical protein GY866_38850, partial [Proteobacteria bacterium]|nr:hypothetical protein [Pseudomonadota bacterium]